MALVVFARRGRCLSFKGTVHSKMSESLTHFHERGHTKGIFEEYVDHKFITNFTKKNKKYYKKIDYKFELLITKC